MGLTQSRAPIYGLKKLSNPVDQGTSVEEKSWCERTIKFPEKKLNFHFNLEDPTMALYYLFIPSGPKGPA